MNVEVGIRVSCTRVARGVEEKLFLVTKIVILRTPSSTFHEFIHIYENIFCIHHIPKSNLAVQLCALLGSNTADTRYGLDEEGRKLQSSVVGVVSLSFNTTLGLPSVS